MDQTFVETLKIFFLSQKVFLNFFRERSHTTCCYLLLVSLVLLLIEGYYDMSILAT